MRLARGVHRDIAYSPSAPDRFHQFDLYAPSNLPAGDKRPSLVCFVHGGAWRREDKGDHAELAQRLANGTGSFVAVPNYRLSPSNPTPETALLHPAHSEDLLAFLNFVLTWQGPDGANGGQNPPYDPTHLVLIGHSCSAHMLTSLFLNSSAVTPSLTPSPELLSSVRAIVMSEGIYDIDMLLESFPTYREWFIENAFGPGDEGGKFAKYNTASYDMRAGGGHITWIVLHSTGDTLVDTKQSQAIQRHLKPLMSHGRLTGEIYDDFTTMDEEHNDLLRGETYCSLVSNFLKQAFETIEAEETAGGSS